MGTICDRTGSRGYGFHPSFGEQIVGIKVAFNLLKFAIDRIRPRLLSVAIPVSNPFDSCSLGKLSRKFFPARHYSTFSAETETSVERLVLGAWKRIHRGR